MTVHRCKKKFELLRAKRRATLRSRREPPRWFIRVNSNSIGAARAVGGGGKGESGWGGGWIFLCNLPERFKNPGDPAIYLALCYAEPRQRKIDGVTATNPSSLSVSFPLTCCLSWFPRLSGHPNPVQTPATTPSPNQWGTTAVAILDGELLNEKDE